MPFELQVFPLYLMETQTIPSCVLAQRLFLPLLVFPSSALPSLGWFPPRDTLLPYLTGTLEKELVQNYKALFFSFILPDTLPSEFWLPWHLWNPVLSPQLWENFRLHLSFPFLWPCRDTSLRR